MMVIFNLVKVTRYSRQLVLLALCICMLTVVAQETSPKVLQSAYIKASNTGQADLFGFSIAIDGDVLAVAAENEASNATGVDGEQDDETARFSGAVYVYRNTEMGWVQEAYVKASNTQTPDQFGHALVLQGDLMAVTAINESSDATGVNGNQGNNNASFSGAVYIFHRINGQWIQEAYLKASNTEAQDGFGWSLSLDGNRLAVGSLLEDSGALGVNGDESDNSAPNSGAVYLFERTNGEWVQTDYIKASNTGAEDQFGYQVALQGGTLAVSSRFEDSASVGIDGNQSDNSAVDSGAVYVYTLEEGQWLQQAYIKASNTDPDDQFGQSLAMHNGQLLVGAYLEDSISTGINGDQSNNSLSESGAAYVFSRENGVWSQQAYLKPDVIDGSDLFGSSAAIHDNLILIGATTEDSSSMGVDGDALNNLATNSGAAYLFRHEQGQWRQINYIKASNTGPEDRFSARLSMDSSHVLVSAFFEDSISVGINGNQDNNSLSDSGAAYLYELIPTFAIGGEVSGLADSNSVVLQNNLSDDLMVSSNGMFTFDQGLIDMQDYSVTVLEQPVSPNQQCNINNALGIVDLKNISNIEVSCETIQYTVGGVVSGLDDGNQLTIQNNGANPLLITSNGSFDFSMPLDDGSSYEISVLTQPSNPIQACRIDQAEGLLSGNNVTDVQVTCLPDTLFSDGFEPIP